ncbi:MAG: lysophospholipid acyltransferase family protein [Agarilytica sp.]
MSDVIPQLPNNVPRYGNAFTRWLGRYLLGISGWKISGELPNLPQLVVCGAPHTSNWDFMVAMFTELALGIKFSYFMKEEAFIWPFKGLFMALGGIPLDRSASQDTVGQISQWFETHEKVWIAITPDGTRSKVDKWKTGFLRIAHQAQVPVLLVAWHYPEKTLHLDTLWQPTGDHAADAEHIREYINARYQGKIPENQ